MNVLLETLFITKVQQYWLLLDKVVGSLIRCCCFFVNKKVSYSFSYNLLNLLFARICKMKAWMHSSKN